jgi:hypothetical protein
MLAFLLKVKNVLPVILAIAKLIITWTRRIQMNDEQKAVIEKLAGEIIAGMESIKAEAAKVKGLRDALAILPDIIKKVEEVAKSASLAGNEKKALAIAVLNKLIDIPWLPEAAEGMIIGLAIDAIITAVNKWFRKAWLEKV